MSSTNTLSKKAIRKAKVSFTAKRDAEVIPASDDAIVVQAKSKKTHRPTEDDDDSKTNSIETKTIDALKNAVTAVIFMNLFTIHCTQNGVDPTLKTIMDNGAASNELLQLLQLLQPTHNESVKNNDKIEGETLKKLVHRNFRSKTLVPVKTDYEAANIKVVDVISNRNCYSAQDVIKNIEAIMSYTNVINQVYLIHGTHEVQLEYLRSILDSNILALLKMVVPDWLKTDVAIKFNTQTDITEFTVRDDRPFTPVDSLLNQCKDSKLFSKFDMIMGYFQVLINPEHAKYTALITHIGKFEYTRMPQGLVNSPSTFARLMVEIFGKIKSLLQYFDDLLVQV
ncbi:hypothetical protein ACTFIW_000805 [Dictyostelium discoideum]